MASVSPPKPSNRPKLPTAVLSDGLLSDAQLETVIYAGEAHCAYLAGSWTVDETGDMVSAAPNDAVEPVRFRRGVLLDDGTGAGKRRQSAGIALDNWAQGRPPCQGSCLPLYFSSISKVGGIGHRIGIFTGTKTSSAEAEAAAEMLKNAPHRPVSISPN